MQVDVGDGASMPVPADDLEWRLRYGQRPAPALEAAEIVAAYRYLTEECTKAEAWRRIKIMRAAATKALILGDN